MALCSANFLLSKSFIAGVDFGEKSGLLEIPFPNVKGFFGLFELGLKDPPLFPNLFDFFSITTEFFP